MSYILRRAYRVLNLLMGAVSLTLLVGDFFSPWRNFQETPWWTAYLMFYEGVCLAVAVLGFIRNHQRNSSF